MTVRMNVNDLNGLLDRLNDDAEALTVEVGKVRRAVALRVAGITASAFTVLALVNTLGLSHEYGAEVTRWINFALGLLAVVGGGVATHTVVTPASTALTHRDSDGNVLVSVQQLGDVLRSAATSAASVPASAHEVPSGLLPFEPTPASEPVTDVPTGLRPAADGVAVDSSVSTNSGVTGTSSK